MRGKKICENKICGRFSNFANHLLKALCSTFLQDPTGIQMRAFQSIIYTDKTIYDITEYFEILMQKYLTNLFWYEDGGLGQLKGSLEHKYGKY